MEILQNIFYFLIGSGLFTWLIRSIFKLYFDKDIEKYKSKLAKELDVHKALHSERMHVIKCVYKDIEQTYKSLERLINPAHLVGEPTEIILHQEFADNYRNFSSFFSENRIFFNEELASEIDNLRKELYSIWTKWELAKTKRDLGESNVKEWGQAWDDLQKKVPELKQKLEKMFRGLLGVN